jgi:tryptophan synthase beta chain
MSDQYRYLLSEKDIPEAWYNLAADLPPVPPVLHPGRKDPVGPADLAPLFAMELIKQEVSTEKYVEIPEPVREVYKLWRPTPLYRARRLEKALDTPAHIYFKYEGVSPVGSHKPNTAVAQAFYAKQQGVNKLVTETGAGQWGSALSMAASFFDMQCDVYMVKVSYQQKPYRRSLIQSFGANIYASPTDRTEAGRKVLAEDPDSLGSLGIAISEAVEIAAKNDDILYSLGSVLNHVMLHQSVIGEEALKQMELADDYPDVVIGCAGGGSNMAGLAFPFIRERIEKDLDTRVLAAEPMACPSLTKGQYTYDFGDTVQMTPLVKMYTLGHTFVPAGIHAGGLRYHGMAPLVCHARENGHIEAQAYHQNPVFEAAIMFVQNEGILPAPESAHAIKAAIDEALEAKKEGKSRTILFNLSGHGHFDLSAYDAYRAGELVDYEYPQTEVDKAMEAVPQIEGY